MKKVIILIGAIALLPSGFAALQHYTHEDYYHGSQLVYQPTDEVPEHIVADYLQNPLNAQQDLSKEPFRPSPYSSHDDEEPQEPPQERPSEHQIPSTSHPDPNPTQLVGARSGHSQWAMVYFPYNSDSTCKNRLTVRSDIAKIARKGFTSIRLHATDCNVLYKAGEAARLHNMRMILGVHIDELGVEAAKPQIEEIITWAQEQGNWDLLEMIVIGEETIFNDFVLPEELAAFITSSRKQFRTTGYTGPITTTEPIPTLHENASTLCPAIDIPAANIHPFFHPEVSADTAGVYVADALSVLGGICPGKAE
ncbi:MAG: hypothetical protein Q9164_003738, partial [Protoblastenia rupestris]